MGVPLTPILKREQTSLKALRGKSFAVDGNIELHQFLALIRKPDGTLLTDKSGHVTSHIIGLLTRTSRLITEFGMKPTFVFDGRPNPLKWKTLDARRRATQKAESEYAQAASRGEMSKAWSKAVMTGRVTSDILFDAKKLLTSMGVPWLEAPEDAEAQASYMAARGDVWAVGGKDSDSLLYGAPVLARYLTITGREFLPARRVVRRLIPELVKLHDNLESLGISREQLVDLAILVGTDFNEGIAGVGPKKALSLLRKHGSLDKLPSEFREKLGEDPDQVRSLFLHPKVTETYETRVRSPDQAGLISFLVGERGFSEARVKQIAHRLAEAYRHQDRRLKDWLE